MYFSSYTGLILRRMLTVKTYHKAVPKRTKYPLKTTGHCNGDDGLQISTNVSASRHKNHSEIERVLLGSYSIRTIQSLS